MKTLEDWKRQAEEAKDLLQQFTYARYETFDGECVFCWAPDGGCKPTCVHSRAKKWLEQNND